MYLLYICLLGGYEGKLLLWEYLTTAFAERKCDLLSFTFEIYFKDIFKIINAVRSLPVCVSGFLKGVHSVCTEFFHTNAGDYSQHLGIN